jgi:uncharacterized Zn-binding protein involved in type VI secretion
MPQVVRKGDICTGHECFPPRPNNAGSPNVFVNGIPVHRKSDTWSFHCCARNCFESGHTSTTVSGSPTVFANGIPVARKGDPVACGSRCNTHSPNVWADG